MVAVQTMSASRTAAPESVVVSRRAAISGQSLRNAWRSRSSAASLTSTAITRSMGRTAQTAAICVTPCAPAPIATSTWLSVRASRSAAAPETAPVRSAVRYVPSMIASGCPVSGSTSPTMA